MICTVDHSGLWIAWESLELSGVSYGTINTGCKRFRKGLSRNWQNRPDELDARKTWVLANTIPVKTLLKLLPTANNAAEVLSYLEQLHKKSSEHTLADRLADLIKSGIDGDDIRFFKKLGLWEGKENDRYAIQLAEAASALRLLNKCRGKVATEAITGYSSKLELVDAVCERYANKPIKGMRGRPDATIEGRRRAMQNKMAKFRQNGLKSLVNGNVGNSYSGKIKTKEQKALVRQLYSRHNAFDLSAIRADYNEVAKQMDWPTVTTQTIRNHVEKHKLQLKSQRNGMGAWRDEFDPYLQRERPSAPMLRLESDGTPYEAYYQKVTETNGKKVRRYWMRKVVVVVIDAYNDYPLGFAIGDQECASLIRAAWKNAMDHVYELTGSYYLPYQVVADNFAHSELEPFYVNMAKYPHVFATVGNSREKVIESWFARYKREVIQKELNYSGKNITAKGEQPNKDYLYQIRHEFPDETGVCVQIENHINLYRKNKGRQEAWLKGWQEFKGQRRLIERKEYLLQFGLRTPGNRLTNKGLSSRLLGDRSAYLIPDMDFYQHVGQSFDVIYDPNNLENILATHSETGESWLVPKAPKTHMALYDMEQDEHKEIQAFNGFRKELKENVLAKNADDWSVLQPLEQEGYLKGMFPAGSTNKHRIQAAEDSIKQIGEDEVMRIRRERAKKVRDLYENGEEGSREAV